MTLHVLAKRHVRILAEFAASDVLLAFDFDGTLAPIVTDPAVARVRASTRRLLVALGGRYPCVVISGRAQHDVVKRVANIPVLHVAGNHGLEPWAEHPRYRKLVQQWIRRLRPLLTPYAGVVIEDKMYSLTIHYRRAARLRHTLDAIRTAVRGLRGARSLGGKYSVSLVPRGAPTKGVALQRACRLCACDTAIYVGDDETDEEVFATCLGEDRILAIRIGRKRDSAAPYYVRNQRELDDVLRALIRLRPVRTSEVHPFEKSPRSR